MSLLNWEKDLATLVHRSKNIDNALSDACIQFFQQVFDNAQRKHNVWFGFQKNTVSLVAGGIWLASIVKAGQHKGIWLLLDGSIKRDGWKTWTAKSTAKSPTPLYWFHTPSFEKVKAILSDQEIWSSYKIASERIFDFHIAAGREDLQKTNGKTRLSYIYNFTTNPLEEIEKYRTSYEALSDTERTSVVQSRVGQGRFRDRLIQYWGGCSATGCEVIELLRASHIKPWRISSNEERLDHDNGLLLVPNLDTAFDTGYISFADDGNILVSHLLSDQDRDRLGIHTDIRLCKPLNSQQRKYLQCHRELFQHRLQSI